MMCQDPLMIDAYQQGKDLYAQIASLSFNTSYRECLEFMTNEDGSFVLDENGEKITYPAGKERRSQAKSILLGILYGRGVPSIAEQLGVSTKKAQQIKDSVMKGFPAIRKFEEDSLEMAETLGYVTTLWGRKRRLPVLMHNDYEFEYATGAGMSGDPLDFDDDGLENEEVPEKICRQYTRELDKTWDPSKREAIKNQAKVHGIIIHDYRNDRQKAVRQVVNSRIQGSSADMSKLAMIKLFQNERLKELGFRMLIPVHDEIIAECPKENTKEVVELFSKIMSEAPGDMFTIPISCDVEVSDRWYGKTVEFEDIDNEE